MWAGEAVAAGVQAGGARVANGRVGAQDAYPRERRRARKIAAFRDWLLAR